MVVQTLPLESLQGTLNPGARAGLEAYLGNVVAGFDEQLETPFAKGEPKEQAEEFYTRIAKSNLSELNDLEIEEIERFGPYSVRLPWEERKAGVLEYFVPRHANDVQQLRANRDAISRLLPAHSLYPLSVEAAFDRMPKNSNLGLPWFSSDPKYRSECLDMAREYDRTGFTQSLPDAVLGWRGQPSGDPNEPKQRVVHMWAHAGTVHELRLQYPLLEALKTMYMFAAWNDLSRVDKVLTQFIDARLPIQSADFHGFDKRATIEAVHAFFDLCRYWFVREAGDLIDWVEDQFLNCGLVTPDGILTGREGAVPSGNGLTNMADTFIQWMMVYDLINKFTGLGDDGVWTGVDDPEYVNETLLDRYGAEVSVDKGGYGIDQCFYLQRLHLKRYREHGLCVGLRSLVRSLNSITHLERFTPDLHEAFFSARAIAIIENSNHHPRFYFAVKWLYEVDKLMKQYDPTVLFSLAGGAEFVEKKLGLDGFRFGKELPSVGLQTFRSVQILRELQSRTNRRSA